MLTVLPFSLLTFLFLSPENYDYIPSLPWGEGLALASWDLRPAWSARHSTRRDGS